MEPLLIVALVFGGVAVIAVIYVIFTYNSLISKRAETDNAWSQINVQLQRRHDLIPNLVETVKGYAKHEQTTLENVIKARNEALSAGSIADKSVAESHLTTAVRGLLMIAEAYPDLKANQNFLALQEELTATENRIGFARQHYNDSATNYNQAILQFPPNIVAKLFGFVAADLFTLDPAEAAVIKKAPKVQF